MVEPRSEREVSGTSSEVERFKISEENAAHVMGVLRDAIYSDKVLAVLREYGANAQDSHRDPAAPPGARERPIEVRLPTLGDPTLQISDFGPGLSHEAVMRLFTQYGASTKRAQADATGFIGIGCKSAFAYSDSFVVVSRNGGRVRTYAAVLDPSDRGEMHLVDDRPAEDPGDTGLTVRVPVRPGDVEEFRAKAPGVFRYYDPQPIVWVGDERLPLGDGACDVVRGCSWTAVMGCVSYPIEVGHLKVPEYVRRSGGVVRFPLGAISVSASREALRYDERTRDALARGLCALVDAHAARLVQGAEGLSDWEKRLRFAGMGLFAPLLRAASFDGVFHEAVFFPRRARGEEKMKVRFSSDLKVCPDARIVFHDDARAIAGYNLDPHAVVARKTPGSTHEEAWEELQAVLAEQRLGGLPVVRASSLPWGSPGTAGGRGPQTRHRGRVFRLLPGEPAPGAPPSARWERLDRDPQPGDLFVPIMGFRPHPWFWGRYASACRAFAAFGLEHPPVYGYRVLGEDSKVPGTDYADWLKTAYSIVRAIRPDLDDLYHISRYSNVHCDSSSPRLVGEMLGDDHPVAALARTALQARRCRYGAEENLIVYAGTLARLAGKDGDPDYSCLDRYPLLRQRAHDFLSSANLGEWMEYVLAVDAAIGDGYRHGAWRERAIAAKHAPASKPKTRKTKGRKAEETK